MSPSIIALLVAGSLGIAAAIMLIPRPNRSLRQVVAARLDQRISSDQPIRPQANRSMIGGLQDTLYRSRGIKPRTAGLLVGVPLVFSLVGLSLVIVAEGGLAATGFFLIVVGPAVIYLDATRRAATRRKEFAEGLPQFLLTVSSAMSAGLTLDQALKELSAGGSSVVEEEFARVTQVVALGESLESALAQMAGRMESDEIKTLRQATGIGRETGSSLTPILETVAESALERAQVRREIGTLTAEGLMSAYVVIALPFLVFVFLLLSQPDYVSVLWTRPAGIGMAVAALAFIAIGWVWLRRLISQETSSV